MLFRAEVRTAALYCLQSAITQQGADLSTSKDTPVQSGKTPSVIVYTDDVKEGIGTAPPTFRTSVLTTVEITAEGATKDEAETLLDCLCALAEDALLNGGSSFQMMFEQIDSVETQVDYKGVDTKRHVFAAVMEIKAHATEFFEPTITTVLSGLNIYVDSQNVFDPNGTYEGQEPFTVPGPPRADGPDGRPEIAAPINLAAILAAESGDVIVTESGQTISIT